jgi:hypothetical protein
MQEQQLHVQEAAAANNRAGGVSMGVPAVALYSTASKIPVSSAKVYSAQRQLQVTFAYNNKQHDGIQ